MDKAVRNKIKGMMKEREKTYKDCADYLNISEGAFQNKINGKSKFYVDELNSLGDFLGISDEEKIYIFLPNYRHSMTENNQVGDRQ